MIGDAIAAMEGDRVQTCPDCGGPMESGVAFICAPEGGGALRLPARCPSAECREARDDRAIADAVRRGVIDP